MYFGSVKFFKNMLLVLVILAVGISSGLAIHYHSQWKRAQAPAANSAGSGGNGSYPAVQTEAIDYQALYPDFYAPQPYNATDRQSNKIYLSFNGALSSDTPALLDILAEKDAAATFFLSGTTDTGDVAALREIVAAGHTIGMSSWSDDYPTLYSSVESYLADAYQLFCYIRDNLGITPTVFRFPGGSVNSYNAGFYQELIAEMVRRGFVPYDWNINLTDMDSINVQTMVDTVMERMTSLDRAIILLRPNAASVEYLPPLLDRFRQAGYTCDALQNTIKPVLFAYPE